MDYSDCNEHPVYAVTERSPCRDERIRRAALVTKVIAQTNSIANGIDANNDGSIGWQTGEGGLAQAQTHMDLMVKGEGL